MVRFEFIAQFQKRGHHYTCCSPFAAKTDRIETCSFIFPHVFPCIYESRPPGVSHPTVVCYLVWSSQEFYKEMTVTVFEDGVSESLILKILILFHEQNQRALMGWKRKTIFFKDYFNPNSF